jgi:uncharacterized membrane protein
MTSPHDDPAIEHRLEAVQAQVLELLVRVNELEARVGAGQVPAVAHPRPHAAPAPTPEPGFAPPIAASFAVQPPVITEPAFDAASTRSPAKLLAATGGGALLLGLVWFVIYAIEQDWLSPGLRFGGAALLSALLTVAAWPLARRGHESVAGAVGGAGLGGWFASWLLARHAHELVSGPQVFVALAVGAAACLLIADRLQLRLMAVLATLAACATPVLVAAVGGHLVELMIYQLAVVAVLMLVDWRRRWPELPTIALLATWMLGARWAALHLGPDNGGVFMLWSVILLAASAASGWRLLQASANAADQAHAQGRLLIAGLLTWAASAAAFAHALPTLALATLGLGCWHAVLAVVLARRLGERNSRVFTSFGWLQAMVAGPLMLTDAALTSWWIGMSVVAVVLPWSGMRRLRTPMILLPAIAALGSAQVMGEPPALPLGLFAAAVLLVASAWSPKLDADEQVDDDVLQRLPLWLAGVGSWAAVVLELGPAAPQIALLWGLVPIVATIGWLFTRLTRARVRLAIASLGLGLLGALAAIWRSEALGLLDAGPASAQALLVVALLGLAGLGGALIWGIRRVKQVERVEQLEDDGEVGPLGIMIALALGLGLALVMSFAFVVLEAGPTFAQLGYTLCAALTGLALLIAGLRLRQTSWRQLALVGIGFAAVKVVGFDLANAAVVWRALGFAGIGVILIAGAYAYSRAQQRLTS